MEAALLSRYGHKYRIVTVGSAEHMSKVRGIDAGFTMHPYGDSSSGPWAS
jgi:hypothetical protein